MLFETFESGYLSQSSGWNAFVLIFEFNIFYSYDCVSVFVSCFEHFAESSLADNWDDLVVLR